MLSVTGQIKLIPRLPLIGLLLDSAADSILAYQKYDYDYVMIELGPQLRDHF
jgi:hypothetical protein